MADHHPAGYESEAGRLLVGSILDPHSHAGFDRLPTELIVRESCGA